MRRMCIKGTEAGPHPNPSPKGKESGVGVCCYLDSMLNDDLTRCVIVAMVF